VGTMTPQLSLARGPAEGGIRFAPEFARVGPDMS
jgi:hypothetical protein